MNPNRSFLHRVVGAALLATASMSAIAQTPPAQPPIAHSAPVVLKGSEPYQWGNVIIGGVEYATGMVWNPRHPELVYIRADGGGIWRLDRAHSAWIPLMDNLTWKDSNLNTADSLAVDPSSTQTIYVAGGGSRWNKPHDILKTTDGGKTWRRTFLKNSKGEDVMSEGNGGDKQGGERLAVDPNHPQTVFFGSRNDGMFVTHDGAKTWQSVPSFPSKGAKWTGITFVQFDGARAIYAGVHAGSAGDDPKAPTVHGAIYRSTDGGNSWEELKGKFPDSFSPLRCRIAPNGTVYVTGVGGTGGVWRHAPDSSATWQDITPPEGKNRPFCGINLNPQNPNEIICAETYELGAVYLSTNGGDSWRQYRFEKGNKPTGSIVLDFYPKWDITDDSPWGGNASDVAFDPLNPKIIYHLSFGGASRGTGIGTDKLHMSLLSIGREQITTGAGISPSAGAPFISGVWDVGGFRHTNLDQIPDHKLAVREADGSTNREGYRNVYQDIFDFDATPAHPETIVAAGGWQWNNTGDATVSSDNGVTFRRFATKPFADAKFGRVAVSVDVANILWAPMGGDKPVYYTKDNGVTWKAAQGAPVGMINSDGPWTFFKPIAADRILPNTFYIYDRRDGKCYRSTNGGENWQQTATLPHQSGAHFDGHQLRAMPGAAGNLWLALYDQGLFHTTDGGLTWSKVENVPWANLISFGKGRPGSQLPSVYLFGQIGGNPTKPEETQVALYRSDDGGHSWVKINDAAHGLNSVGNLTGDMQVWGRVYCGTGGRGFFVGSRSPKRVTKR